LRADNWDIAAYLLVAGAAGARVLLPLLAPASTLFAVGVSAVLWCTALSIYAVRYARVLALARLDGKPG
jgi:uncharacterized protein involved in response to NO